MNVIGIDPGLAATGVGIVCGNAQHIERYAFGSITTGKELSLAQRLDHIYTRLETLLQSQTPDLMVVEEVFSLHKYPKSGITLGKVCGVILLAGCKAGIPVIEIPVREAKQVLTGNGNADKNQFELAVRHRLQHPAPVKPDHASDALGLALIGLMRYDRRRCNKR